MKVRDIIHKNRSDSAELSLIVWKNSTFSIRYSSQGVFH